MPPRDEYPPPPWRLGGNLLVSAFLVPVAQLPGHRPPGRFTRAGAAGRAVVGVAFAEYTPAGVLAYDELLVAIGGFLGARPVSHIPQIWVDSPASLAGGRELWDIPKELGSFARHEGRVSMQASGRPVAELSFALGRPLLPGLRRIPLGTAQRGNVARNLVLARVRHLRARWSFDPQGPLAYLHGRRPLVSAGLMDATVVFGL